MATPQSSNYAPGIRLRIRDEEWSLRQTITTNQGRTLLKVTGLSPLVRDLDFTFLEDQEEDISIIDPHKTQPIQDESAYYQKSRLLLETMLRGTAPSDSHIHLGHKAAIDVLPYQLKPATMALEQLRPRILIADAVGLGKTIECGILLTELIKRGRARRILVVTVKSMLEQFQQELWSRFSIPLVRLDSVAIRRIRSQIPSNQNPFHFYDKSIVSIDTLKQAGDYRRFLKEARWDVIVIDEAHNVASRSAGSQRSKLAEDLSNRADSLILLSATPHDGRKKSFASLINLLDPTAIADPDNYGPHDIAGLYIRRFKKDIRDQILNEFPERKSSNKLAEPTAAERAIFTSLAALELQIDREQQNRRGAGASMLVKTLLSKTFSSSPAACSSVLSTRLKNLEKTDPDSPDIPVLRQLKASIDELTPEDFSKYGLLVNLLRKGGELGWTRKTDDRLVIFTESIPTLKFLEKHLPAAIGLQPEQYTVLSGSMADTEQMSAVANFSDAGNKLRLLLCSDVASEGINLHHQAHRLIHFDIPWSLLTFQQRNGRIDRYGQIHCPEITYLFTNNEGYHVRGDSRVLQVLVEKDRQVQENIGDPLEFDILKKIENLDEEQLILTRLIDQENACEELETQLAVPDEFDFTSFFSGEPDEEKTADATAPAEAETCTLFRDDYEYVKTLCEFAKQRREERSHGKQTFNYQANDQEKRLSLEVPQDFYEAKIKRHFPGTYKSGDTWHLCAKKEQLNGREQGWPMTQYLWERHPLVDWLASKVAADFPINTAPLIVTPHLPSGQRLILGQATIPNLNGVPIVQLWQGILFNGDTIERLLTAEESLALCDLRQSNSIPNSGTPPLTDPGFTAEIQRIISSAVDRLQAEALQRKKDYEAQTGDRMEHMLRRLEDFKSSRTEQLQLQFTEWSQKKRRDTAINAVEQAYQEAWEFVNRAFSGEDHASVLIAAIFVSGKEVVA